MKKIILLLISTLIALTSCVSTANTEEAAAPQVEFVKDLKWKKTSGHSSGIGY